MSYTTNQYTRKILYLVRVFGFTGTYLHGNGVNVFSKCNMSVLAHTKVFLHNVRIRCCTHKRAKHEMLYQVYSCRRLTPTNVPDIIFSACIDLWYKTQGGRVSGGKKKKVFDNSAITQAAARGFANGLSFGRLWDVLLWL